MLTVNHILIAGILGVLMAFSPMSIGKYYGTSAPMMSTISFPAE